MKDHSPANVIVSVRYQNRLSLQHGFSRHLCKFCRRWQVAKMSLFGSVLRDDFDHSSDINVLVEFEPGGVPGLQFVSMASELSHLLGRPVDVMTRSAVERSPNHIRRKAILDSAEIIYAAR